MAMMGKELEANQSWIFLKGKLGAISIGIVGWLPSFTMVTSKVGWMSWRN